VLLEPHESLAAAAGAGSSSSSSGCFELVFGPPLDSDRRMGLCHMDLFGQYTQEVQARLEQQQQHQQEEEPVSVLIEAAARSQRWLIWLIHVPVVDGCM